MGLDAYLEDEFGEEVSALLDEDGALARAWPTGDPAYPLLRFVDVEGSTIFNRLQCPEVLSELAALERSVPALKPKLSFLQKLARRAASEPHLYLRFLGD